MGKFLVLLTLSLLMIFKLEAQIPGDPRNIKNPFEEDFQKKKIALDSSIYKIVDRNFQSWDSVLVVIDWTSSMYENGFQLFVWLALHESQKNKFRKYVFFNDGDNKEPHEKITGDTGGIYCTEDNSLKGALELMQLTAANGTGGDGQENDIEALLEGIRHCMECKDIVLIADSKSTIRDFALLPQLIQVCRQNQQSIHVLLAGFDGNLLTEYLLMAYKTNGSVHTLDEDVENLLLLNEHKKITIGEKVFQVRKGYLVEKFIKK